jgi:purine-nucleoside phosphorylase
MISLIQKINEATAYVRSHIDFSIDIALTLGTGLSSLETLIEKPIVIPYQSIPYFPTSTVTGHNGKMILGKLEDKYLLILSGRVHYYEGYDMDEVTFYIHILKELGVKELIITNASGGLNDAYEQGQIIMVQDHINMFPQNPLRGLHHEALGPRFPDMLQAYSVALRNKMKNIYSDLQEGVYLGWPGPSLETKAEFKMAKLIGADIVGMSSVPEVIVAKYRSLPVLMLSVVSNVVNFDSDEEILLEDILHQMQKSAEKLKSMIQAYCKL